MSKAILLIIFVGWASVCNSQELLKVQAYNKFERSLEQHITFDNEHGIILTVPTGILDTIQIGSSKIKYDLAPDQFAYDYYANLVLFDSSLSVVQFDQAIRYIYSPPEADEDGFTFAGFYTGSNGSIEIGGFPLEWDSTFSQIWDENSYFCQMENFGVATKCLHLQARYSDILHSKRIGNDYYLVGNVMDEFKWNGDSTNVLSVDSHCESFSFLAKLDQNLNLKWRIPIHSLPQDFDPYGSPQVFRNATIGNVEIEDMGNGNIGLFGTHEGGGMRFGDDTIYTHDQVSFRIDALALVVDSNGVVRYDHKFRNDHEGSHKMAVSDGKGYAAHLVRLKQFQFEGKVRPEGDYMVFYNDTLGVVDLKKNA